MTSEHIQSTIFWEFGEPKETSFTLDGILDSFNGPAVIRYTELGEKYIESWYSKGRLHRQDEPARIWYAKNGKVSSKEWYQNGVQTSELCPGSVSYYQSGKKMIEEWRLNNEIHRTDLGYFENTQSLYMIGQLSDAAYTRWYESGIPELQQWYHHGVLHRVSGPAVIFYYPDGKKKGEFFYSYGVIRKQTVYYENGKKQEETWYNKEGVVSRITQPAYVSYFPNEHTREAEWRTDGILTREDQPAHEVYDENGNIEKQEYYTDGVLNRSDGPAVMLFSETRLSKEMWYRNGHLHSGFLKGFSEGKVVEVQRPAVIHYNEETELSYLNKRPKFEAYYIDSILHRPKSEGPASTEYHLDGSCTKTYIENGLVSMISTISSDKMENELFPKRTYSKNKNVEQFDELIWIT